MAKRSTYRHARYGLAGAIIFTGEDSAWASPKAFTALANGTVLLRVAPFTAGSGGTYAVAYSTHANVVTCNANGGGVYDGGDTVVHTVPLRQPAGALPVPASTSEGYGFAGWSTSAGGPVNFSAETIVNANITVYAQWSVNTWTVTFNNNGGGGGNPTTKTVVWPATDIDALPAEAPVRTGYTFVGWNTSEDGSGDVFTAAQTFNTAASGGALSVYAHWTPITYTIVYDKNTQRLGNDGVFSPYL